MTKSDLLLLENVFTAEISGGVFQTKSKQAKRLEDKGYLQKIDKYLGNDRFGKIVVTGYVLTLLGNATYCTSDLCLESPETMESK